jgi:hypothetical protein
MAYDAQEQVVRGYSVAACSHRFLARKIDDGIKFVRYGYFHDLKFNLLHKITKFFVTLPRCII